MNTLDKANVENNQKLADEDLKLKEIDQLHAAVLEFGKKCFETKKMFATIILAYITFAVKFDGDKLNSTCIGGGIILIFWWLDADSYYYQTNLRHTMTKIMNEIRTGRGLESISGVGMPINGKKSETNMRLRSYMNRSQFIYMGVFIVALIIVILVWIY